MEQRTWPYKSDSVPRYTSLQFTKKQENKSRINNPTNHFQQFNPKSQKSHNNNDNNIPRKVPHVGSEEVSVCADFTPTSGSRESREVVFERPSIHENSQKSHNNNNITRKVSHVGYRDGSVHADLTPSSGSREVVSKKLSIHENSQQSHNLSNFSQLPNDVLLKIAATFSLPNLRSASQVCKSWCDGLKPLREAMLFLKYGKCFKHGRGGVKVNLNKALDSFLKGVERGSTLAMVDAGLVYWEMGKKDEGMCLYRKAAVLGDPAGQCNLGICLLQANPPEFEEAIKWLNKAAVAGYVRAQYQLALCLHKGHGPNKDLHGAAKWYLMAAEGGYVRAMYNTAICYSVGEGLVQSHRLSRKWMKRAADRGHSKAQFEYGLSLFAEGNMTKAVVYLELATRAGETAADHVKYVILQQMSASSRDRAMLLADNWRALPSSSH